MSANVQVFANTGKRYGYTICLPGKLVLAVRDKLPPLLQHDGLRIASAMYLRQMREDEPFANYLPTSLKYIFKLFQVSDRDVKDPAKNNRAYDALRMLIKTRILEVEQILGRPDYLPPRRNRSGIVKELGQCRNLRIKPSLLYGPVDYVRNKFKPTRKKLDEIENTARMHLEDIQLPFCTSEDLADWVQHFVRTAPIQRRITDRINELKPKSERNYPKVAFLVEKDAEDSTEFSQTPILRDRILANLRPGNRIYAYKGKSGKIRYYIGRLDEIVSMKTAQMEVVYISQLSILNQARLVSRNKKNRRKDTPLTNLFSQLIALITVKDQRLVGIDVVNSQFTFFAGILEEALQLVETDPKMCTFFSNNTSSDKLESNPARPIHLEKDKSAVFALRSSKYRLLSKLPRKILEEVIPYLLGNNEVTYCESTIKPCEKRLEATERFADIKQFIKVCREGHLYEYIAARKFYGKDLDELSTEEKITLVKDGYRSRAKDAMLALAFDKWHAYKWNKQKAADRAILSEIFPSVLALVDHIKIGAVKGLEQFRSQNKRLYDHFYFDKGNVPSPDHIGNALFAVTLQRVESAVMIDGVFRKCMRKYWAASKHDSILCVVSQFEKVLKVMRKELDSVLGVGNYRLKKQSWVYDPETMKIETIEEKLNF